MYKVIDPMNCFDHAQWQKNVMLRSLITNASDGDLPTEYQAKQKEQPKEVTYGIKDFVYSHNEDGFRGESFKTRGEKLTVLVIGDSFTYGTGLPEEHVWWKHIIDAMGSGVVCHNLGMGGSGPDYSSSVVNWYLQTYGKPDLVLYCVSSLTRQNIPHHIEPNGTIHSDFYIGNDFIVGGDNAAMHVALGKVYTPRTYVNRSLMHIRMVDSWFNESNTPIYYCSWNHDTLLQILEYAKDHSASKIALNLFRQPMRTDLGGRVFDMGLWRTANEKFPQTTARDFMHLGPRQHYVFSQIFLNYLKNKDEFKKLCGIWE